MATPEVTTDLALVVNGTDADPYLHLEVLKASVALLLAKIDTVRREILAYQEESETTANQIRFEMLLAVCLTGTVILVACYSKRLCRIVGRCTRNCGRLCIASTRDDDDEKKLATSEELQTFVCYGTDGDTMHFTQEDIKREIHRQAIRNLRAQFEHVPPPNLTGSLNSGFTADGHAKTPKKHSKDEGNKGEGPAETNMAPSSTAA